MVGYSSGTAFASAERGLTHSDPTPVEIDPRAENGLGRAGPDAGDGREEPANDKRGELVSSILWLLGRDPNHSLSAQLPNGVTFIILGQHVSPCLIS